MATAKSGTLAINTATPVTVDVEAFGSGQGVGVTNWSSDDSIIWVRTDGQPASVGGDNCVPVLGSRQCRIPEGKTTATISLFCNTATGKYTVEGNI